jgi:DNA-binding transcriptional MerR regulator
MLTIGDFARLGPISPRMLRHYDEIGLLRPDRVDPTNAYRSYGVAQLATLHRLLALRDLGLTLEQIRELLSDDPSPDHLRGMLRLRRAQIERTLGEEQARLGRVEAHIRALEGSTAMQIQDIVTKATQPMRIVEATGTAPGFGSDNLGPLFMRLVPEVITRLEAAGARPGVMVAWYEEPADDGTVGVHAGFAIGDQAVVGTDRVRIVDLPVIEVASVVHRGSMDGIEAVYEALLRWIEDSGYRQAGFSRELYHEWHEEDSGLNVTEIQMPIAR